MTTFVVRDGDLLADDADALVNPVNCVGVMGAGLARQFKARWPKMFEDYQHDCRDGYVRPGQVTLWQPDGGKGRPVIVNFPTKRHWRDRTLRRDVHGGLADLRRRLEGRSLFGYPVQSIAIPALGCGLGGLDWREVRLLIETYLNDIDGLEVRIYPPTDAG